MALSEKNPKLVEVFCRDAEKAVATLRETAVSGDIKLFTTTAHAMRSALLNIGEPQKAELAGALEDAGNRGDADFISANAENFIKVLEALIQGLKPTKTANESNEDITEDTTFLKEQLLIIKAACENYDDTAVYAAIDTLRTKPLKPETDAMLGKIRDKIYLNSDFDEAALMIETFWRLKEKKN